MYAQRSRAYPLASVASRQRWENSRSKAILAAYGSLVSGYTSSPSPIGTASNDQAPPAHRIPPFSWAAA